MTVEADLNIAEIPYESGAIKFRYSRVMSPDKTRWIRHGLFIAYHESGAVASEPMGAIKALNLVADVLGPAWS